MLVRQKVYDNVEVFWLCKGFMENAEVYGEAKVFWLCLGVLEMREFFGKAEVYDRAWVSGDAEVSGNARVYK